MKVLKKGLTGAEVVQLQQLLAGLGYTGISADGVFGTGTEAAVMDFQSKHGLTADGIVGDKTWALLTSSGGNGPAPAPSPSPQTVKVLIDNGHGSDTPGKCSPDGSLREYAYAREIAKRLEDELGLRGIGSVRIVPEETDISLKERVARANSIYDEGGRQAVLVSVHCNAAGSDGKWKTARGWSVYIDPTASQNSKRLAKCMTAAARAKGVKLHQSSDYQVESLYICKNSRCPAVLVENFFQDNKEDVAFLLSEEGKKCVTDIMADGITGYLGI